MQKGKGKGKGKHNNTEAMPIVVVGNTTELWEQYLPLQKLDLHT